MGDWEEVWVFVKTSVIFVVRLSRMDSVERVSGCVVSVASTMEIKQFESLLDQDIGKPRPCSDTMLQNGCLIIFQRTEYIIYRRKERF